MVLEDHCGKKALMNNKYLFFYDQKRIEFINIYDHHLHKRNIQKVNFDIEDMYGGVNGDVIIKSISVGSNSDEIAIVISHPMDKDNDCIF